MTFSTVPPRKIFAPAALALLAVLSVGCATKRQYEKVAMSDDKLATPPHHMSANDYPFDDDGTYRKDWVTNKNAKRGWRWGKKRSSSGGSASSVPPTHVASAPAPGRRSAPPPPTIAPPRPPAPVVSKPSPPPPKPARYHTVSKGDTLFSLGRRYGVSVTRLKSTNGLNSDLIRIGQTLRIP